MYKTFGERLAKIIDFYENGNQSEFARKTEYHQGNLNTIIRKKPNHPIPITLLLAIGQVYKDLNLRWLLYGEGDIFISHTNLPYNTMENTPKTVREEVGEYLGPPAQALDDETLRRAILGLAQHQTEMEAKMKALEEEIERLKRPKLGE